MPKQSPKAEAADLLTKVPPEVIGSRLARARHTACLSVRTLAEAADINKNSVLHIEKGGAARPDTIIKICNALGLHLASLARPSTADGDGLVAIHRHANDRWYSLTKLAEAPVEDRPLEPKEREKLAKDGNPAPMLMLSSRLESGQLLPNVIELYAPSELRSHPGEETIYVLQGTLELTVGESTYTLEEGESATFWSSEQHAYAPAQNSPLPVRIFSVAVHRQPGTIRP